ncbi:hypothetical protein BYT27DRAFT_7226611 [Phlegmacium glaucopus]|nr:hypothetical protein BYT27DRAFT_7226611 [Phlegmacium glaucopus]
MPAERTREQRDRLDEASAWLSATDNDLAFAPNVTPGMFSEFHTFTPYDTGCDATLFPPLEGTPATRRSGHGRKKPLNHIPRPPNAFILFRSSFIKSQHVSSEVETNHSTLSKIIGLTWQNLPNEERQIWHARAKVALEEHKRKFPSYAFRPIHNKPRALPGEKRKVREVGPKDHTRCAKIAELLVRGKKGLELEVAIQEFDKNHVPEIITRFEAPMTANTYESASLNNTSKRTSKSPSPLSINPAPMSCEDSYDTPSFNQQSLSLPALSPSFDFNTFPFSSNSPSPPSYTETLAPAVGPLQFTYNQHDMVHPRPSISIPNNYRLMDEWTQSSSPISNPTDSLPTTPCQMNDPYPEPYTPFTLDPHSDNSSYADHSLYPTFSNVHAFGGNEYGDIHPGGYLPCEPDHKTPVTQEDLDFSTFMASLPSYSL